MSGIKHLVECHCILPQFRKRENLIYHKFPVYSKLDEHENIIHKFVSCNNCEAVHKIIDVCKSEIISGMDDVKLGITEEEISHMLPDNVRKVLYDNQCNIATYEQILDQIECKEWNIPVILSRKIINDSTHVKTFTLIEKDKFKIDSNLFDFTIER